VARRVAQVPPSQVQQLAVERQALVARPAVHAVARR
jgi:hypothetical protein